MSRFKINPILDQGKRRSYFWLIKPKGGGAKRNWDIPWDNAETKKSRIECKEKAVLGIGSGGDSENEKRKAWLRLRRRYRESENEERSWSWVWWEKRGHSNSKLGKKESWVFWVFITPTEPAVRLAVFIIVFCVFVCEMVEGREEREREIESRREGGNLLLPYYFNFLGRKGFWIKIFNHAPFL